MIFLQRILILSLMLAARGSSALAEADETIYTKVDENPIPLKTPPPRYPASLKSEGVSGVVAVVIVIDETGSVKASSISKSSNPEFEKPALEAVKNWKFKPAKKDGKSVKVQVVVPLRFTESD
jgi:protein TonB